MRKSNILFGYVYEKSVIKGNSLLIFNDAIYTHMHEAYLRHNHSTA